MSTTFLSKKGFKELQKEISGLEISEKALILELKEIGRAKSRDDKLHRNDVITQLEKYPIKNLYEEGYFTPRQAATKEARSIENCYWLSRGFGGSTGKDFPLHAGS